MIRIRASYECPEELRELQKVLASLGPNVKHWRRAARCQDSRYKRAYVDIELGEKRNGVAEK